MSMMTLDEFEKYYKKNKKKILQEKADSGKTLSLSEFEELYGDTIKVNNKTTTKKSDTNKVFKKSSAYDDDEGNVVSDTILSGLATVGDVGINLTKGILNLGEGVTDLVQYGASGIVSMFDEERADKIKQRAMESATDKLLGGIEEKVDRYSFLGDKADSVAQGLGYVGGMMLTGGIGSALGLGTAGASALTTGATFLSGMGGGMGEAYSSGATGLDATTYGAIKGTGDAISELMFGGLGKAVKVLGLSKGISALDDVFAQKLTSKVTNQVAKNFMEFGVKAGAEGTEEVLAGLVSAVGKKVTYMKDEELVKLVENEQLLDQFISGAIVSGFAQSGYVPGMKEGSLREANKRGADFITGYTQNEQKVTDAIVEQRVNEAKKEGKTLTKKQIEEIRQEVDTMMDRGEIDLDTIEKTLGGDAYTQHENLIKDSEEFERLRNTKDMELTDVERDRLAELKANNRKTPYKKRIEESKNNLSTSVMEMVKNDSRLQQSYLEKSKRSQSYEVDTTKKYTDKEMAIVNKAKESGFLNNTRKTHEMVDLVAKLSAEQNMDFDFATNQSLKDSGFAIEGKTINGFKQGNKITVNVQSKNALNTVVGHEITHVLEGTDLYKTLQDTVIEYAKTKGVYDAKYKEVVHLYRKQFQDNDLESRKELYDSEITADLIGEYIFNDVDFVKNLSVKDKNLFQKIYDEIKYFLKTVTAGSDAEKQLLKAKKMFEDAYKESSKQTRTEIKNAKVEYSLSTEYDTMPKPRPSLDPTSAQLQKTEMSVRDVRKDTMLKNNYTVEQVEQTNKFFDEMGEFMKKAGMEYKYIGLEDVNNAKLKITYDNNGNPQKIVLSAMVKNGDYPVNFDFTSICKKRQSISLVVKELAQRQTDGQRTLDVVNMSPQSLWKINEELRKAGLETACLGCFVESKRYNIQNFSTKATRMWNKIVNEVREEQGIQGNVEYFNFAEGIDLDTVDYSEVDRIFKEYKTKKGRTSPEKRMRALIQSGGAMYQKYLQPSDLMTPEGIEAIKSMSSKKNNFYGILQGVYGQASPKEVMGFSPYNSEIALLPEKKGRKPMADYIKEIGGVRMQSFSDFLVANVYDYMQMVGDLSARHLPAHAYTKELAFAKIFGQTGIKINMSVMFDIDSNLGDEYAGLTFVEDENGNEEYNGVKGRFEYLVADQKRSDAEYEKTGHRPYVQSIPYDEAVELQNDSRYSKNVGIIGVGYSDNHILKMLGDNDIRYVIPYHASSLPAIIKDATKIRKATDYTNYQTIRNLNSVIDGNGNTVDFNEFKNQFNTISEAYGRLQELVKNEGWQVNVGGQGKSKFNLYKDLEKTNEPKKTAENYLNYCAKNNLVPVFEQFAGHENYYKLLFDFDPYDSVTGEYAPQMEVANIYDGYNQENGELSTEAIQEMIDDEMFVQNEKNRERNEKIPSVVDSVLEQLDMKEDVQYSVSEDTTQTDNDYLKAENDDSWLNDLSIDALMDELLNMGFDDFSNFDTDDEPERKPRVKRRVDEVNKRLKEIGLTFNGTKNASWTDERIDKYLDGGYYASSNPNYAQAYITYMSPYQFLNLTTGGNTSTLDMIQNESAEYGEIDFEKLGNDSPVRLYIEEGKNGAKVVGHEGRHRMYLLGQAGFEKIPVLMFDYNTKYNKSYKNSLKLTAQRFNDTDFISKTRDVTAWDVVPFSQGNRDLIIEKFGSGNVDADIHYSISDQNQQIAPRKSGNIYSEDVMLESQPLGLKDISPIRSGSKNISASMPKPLEGDGEVRGVRIERAEREEIAKVLAEEPKTESQRNKRKWAIFKANVLDKGAVFEDLSLKAKNRDLMGKWDYTLTSEARAQYLMGNGDKNAGVKSLNSIREEVADSGRTEEFYDYMYHALNVDRMTLEERFKNVENKPVFGYDMTAGHSKSIVEQYEKKYPKFRTWAKEVYDYQKYLRKELVYAEIITEETAELWSRMYPHYIPIRRVDGSNENANVFKPKNWMGVNAPVKGATGGNTDILPLFDTMAMRTQQTYRATARNNFGVELKYTLGDIGQDVETSIDDIIDDVSMQGNLLVEGMNGKNPRFTVFEDGKKKTFEITKDMYDALKPLEESSFLSKTIKPLNVASSFHRGLLTEYNPVFMVTNVIKDAQDVFINSQHSAKTYAKIPEAFQQILQKGYWYEEYMRNGGEHNSYFDSETHTFKTDDEGLKKLLNLPPLSTISKMNNFVELIPRLSEYIASREMGATVETAMLDASRVTTNFKAGGDFTKFLNRNGATFLNASVQGAMQQVRNVREAKANGLKGWVNLAVKFGIAGLPVMFLNSLLWDDDEEYEELSDYVKQNYYVLYKTDDGQFVRIPKGRTMAVIQDAFQQVSNFATGNDEVDMASFLELAVSNLAPNNPLENNVLSPIIQVKNNKTWYGEDLVPSRLADLPANEQYDESTDRFSKWLGQNLNISPVKINYLLDQYSGGVGDVILPMLTPEAESGEDTFLGNAIAPIKDKFITDSTMNNQNVSDFYDLKDELTTNAKMQYATDEDVLMNKYINAVNSEMIELYTQKREIQNSDLPNSEKYEQVKELQRQIVELTKEGLGNYQDVEVDDGFARVGDRYYRKDDDGSWKKINDEQYEKQTQVTETLGISVSEYWNNKKEYDYAYNNPSKYALAKSVGGYDAYQGYIDVLWDIKADKDANGKSISGTRKRKVLDYINGLDVDYYTKLILFKSEYSSYDDSNYEIIEYLNNREDISYEEEVAILTELGFTVSSNGRVSW